MSANNFIWADLSAYRLNPACDFYRNIFGWEYYSEDGAYKTAFANNNPTAGIYLMPKKFKDMNMPSFWMSYIQVDDVLQTVEIARTNNGIVELVDTNAAIGKIALIRDPSGAGFTVYEGNTLSGRTKDKTNTLVWNELFVSNFKLVEQFYTALFDWTIEEGAYHRSLIKNSKGETISAIQEVSNEVKGRHEYWAVYFGVSSLDETIEKIRDQGGACMYKTDSYAVCLDLDQAVFHISKV